MRVEDINSLEAESGVITTVIHHPEYIYHSDELLPNHFTDKQNRCVYMAIEKLADKGIKTIDAFNIIESLNSSDSTKRLADELTIQESNRKSECSLHKTLHRIILETAVQLALASRGVQLKK